MIQKMGTTEQVEALVKIAKEKDMEISKKDIEFILKENAALAKATVSSGIGYKIGDIGSLKISHRKARIGRNPKTNEEMPIPESHTVTFSPSSSLKDAMKGYTASQSDKK